MQMEMEKQGKYGVTNTTLFHFLATRLVIVLSMCSTKGQKCSSSNMGFKSSKWFIYAKIQSSPFSTTIHVTSSLLSLSYSLLTLFLESKLCPKVPHRYHYVIMLPRVLFGTLPSYFLKVTFSTFNFPQVSTMYIMSLKCISNGKIYNISNSYKELFIKISLINSLPTISQTIQNYSVSMLNLLQSQMRRGGILIVQSMGSSLRQYRFNWSCLKYKRSSFLFWLFL